MILQGWTTGPGNIDPVQIREEWIHYAPTVPQPSSDLEAGKYLVCRSGSIGGPHSVPGRFGDTPSKSGLVRSEGLVWGGVAPGKPIRAG